jgi:hypothetical protein
MLDVEDCCLQGLGFRQFLVLEFLPVGQLEANWLNLNEILKEKIYILKEKNKDGQRK